jgi:hypothetical protein
VLSERTLAEFFEAYFSDEECMSYYRTDSIMRTEHDRGVLRKAFKFLSKISFQLLIDDVNNMVQY